MPKLLVSVFALLAFAPTIDAAARPDPAHAACPGVKLALFEQRVPEQVERYPFDSSMLEPFVALWRAGRRPELPVRPERVTVYAVPGQPFLVGYQSGDCVIAVLTVDRQRLLRLLRPRIGWSV